MKRPWAIFLGLLALAALAQGPAPAPLKLVQTIPLPGVEGRMDHMSVALSRQLSADEKQKKASRSQTDC